MRKARVSGRGSRGPPPPVAARKLALLPAATPRVRAAASRRPKGHSRAAPGTRVSFVRVSVVGLGPGPSDLITPAATARLRLAGARVFARTRFFPGLDELLSDLAWESFDDVYETAPSLDAVSDAIVDRLL